VLDGLLLGLRNEPEAEALRLLYPAVLWLQHLQLLRAGARVLPDRLLRPVHPLQVHEHRVLIRAGGAAHRSMTR
jgi:hypothetical protein